MPGLDGHDVRHSDIVQRRIPDPLQRTLWLDFAGWRTLWDDDGTDQRGGVDDAEKSAKLPETEQSVAITPREYDLWQRAHAFFNEKLFDNLSPDVFHTYQRQLIPRVISYRGISIAVPVNR